MTISLAKNQIRWMSIILLALCFASLVLFYAFTWIESDLAVSVFDADLEPGANSGWELFDWARETGASAKLWLSIIWLVVPVATLAALVQSAGPLLVDDELFTQLDGIATWVGVVMTAANLVALVMIFFGAGDAGVLKIGFWLAVLLGIFLPVGFGLRLWQPQEGIVEEDLELDAALPPGNARLLIHSGLMEGAYPRIVKSPFSIGRQNHNDLVLFDDLTVSRHHVDILYHDEVYFLRAASEDRLVWVGKNPESLRQELSWRLETGDMFTIGESLIEFVIEPETQPEPA
jgi:hypothetical protein